MTVVWKLQTDDIKAAVEDWMRNQHGVTVDTKNITIHVSAVGAVYVEVGGEVELGMTTGPYR